MLGLNDVHAINIPSSAHGGTGLEYFILEAELAQLMDNPEPAKPRADHYGIVIRLVLLDSAVRHAVRLSCFCRHDVEHFASM